MKLILFASDTFALEPLEALRGGRHDLLAVVGTPDRPAGRGLTLEPTPAVRAARDAGLDVFQPAGLDRRSTGAFAENCQWDLGVVVAYGRLVPRWLLDLPPLGFVNLHPSLLPRYRGAAPVERALMNGASITGVTTILMNERLDSGDILIHAEVPINEEDSAGTLRDRLSHAGARLLAETLDRVEDGSVRPVPQEEEKATYAPPVTPGEARIDWSAPAEVIDRLVRAMDPQPGAFTYFRGRRVKIWSVRVSDVPQEDEPGTIMNLGKEGFVVNTGSSGIQVLTLQPEGRKRMSAAEFSRGQRLVIAERFASGPAE